MLYYVAIVLLQLVLLVINRFINDYMSTYVEDLMHKLLSGNNF